MKDPKFNELTTLIKVAIAEDKRTLALQKEATEVWKKANEELTRLDKELKTYVADEMNKATGREPEFEKKPEA